MLCINQINTNLCEQDFTSVRSTRVLQTLYITGLSVNILIPSMLQRDPKKTDTKKHYTKANDSQETTAILPSSKHLSEETVVTQ